MKNIEQALVLVKPDGIKKSLTGHIKKAIQDRDAHSVAVNFSDLLDTRELATKEILSFSRQYLSPKCGSEAVLSIGTGIEWLENTEFAGVISVMPHGCMPGGIVAAMSEKLSQMYGKPWINLTYDGTRESNNRERINNFAEVIKFCSSQRV